MADLDRARPAMVFAAGGDVDRLISEAARQGRAASEIGRFTFADSHVRVPLVARCLVGRRADGWHTRSRPLRTARPARSARGSNDQHPENPRDGARGAPPSRGTRASDTRHRRRVGAPHGRRLWDLWQRLRAIRRRARHAHPGDPRARAARNHREDRRRGCQALGSRRRRPGRRRDHHLMSLLPSLPRRRLPALREAARLLVHAAVGDARALGCLRRAHGARARHHRSQDETRHRSVDRGDVQPARRGLPVGGGDSTHAAGRHGGGARPRTARPRVRARMQGGGSGRDHRHGFGGRRAQARRSRASSARIIRSMSRTRTRAPESSS